MVEIRAHICARIVANDTFRSIFGGRRLFIRGFRICTFGCRTRLHFDRVPGCGILRILGRTIGRSIPRALGRTIGRSILRILDRGFCSYGFAFRMRS